MKKADFLKNFQLNTLQPSFQQFEFPYQKQPASVLIALVEQDEQLMVLLTKRAAHLKHHAGQISFPGGKVEKIDQSPADTATREAWEEIGLPQKNVEIIGQLQSYQTITGFIVSPMVALIKPPKAFQLDENEVAELFYVPLAHFLDASNHNKVFTTHKGKRHPVYFIQYQHYNIWGATAAMLIDLVKHIR